MVGAWDETLHMYAACASACVSSVRERLAAVEFASLHCLFMDCIMEMAVKFLGSLRTASLVGAGVKRRQAGHLMPWERGELLLLASRNSPRDLQRQLKQNEWPHLRTRGVLTVSLGLYSSVQSGQMKASASILTHPPPAAAASEGCLLEDFT